MKCSYSTTASVV